LEGAQAAGVLRPPARRVRSPWIYQIRRAGIRISFYEFVQDFEFKNQALGQATLFSGESLG
jgi:hypothetical protein